MRLKFLAGLAIMAALSAAPAMAQTMGAIQGTVVDAQGAVLPGVTVTATSPQMQGVRTSISDSVGQFRFPTVPPGTFTVKGELSGFQPATQENVRVGIDQTITLNLKLQIAGVTQAVTVQGTAPIVDTTTAAGGVTVDQAMMTQLPVARDFYGTARFAPGVTNDAVGPTALGSTGAENKYLIEGIDATGIMTGERQKTVLVDFIQETNVKTEGANAEYGRFTGTIVEAVTKSGGNTFHGSLYGFGQGGSLQAANTTASLRPQTSTTVASIGHQWDVGGTLGGFVVKDKLWFFGAYNPFNERDNTTLIRPIPGAAPGTPASGSVVPLTLTRNLYSGKATYNAASSQTFVFSIVGDPQKRDGNIFGINGPPSTWQGTIDSGAADFIGRYDGVFGSSWLVRAQGARHKEIQTYGGAGAGTPLQINTTVNPQALSGGFGYHEDHDFKRDYYRADVTRYLGGHTLKGGADFMRVDAKIDRFDGGGGQRIYQLASGGTTFYRHRFYVNDQASGFDRTSSATWVLALPLSSEPVDKSAAAYVQDSWKVLSNVTIEGGVRWERQNVGDRFGGTVINLNKNWAGRVGATIDPMNDGKGKIFAHYGRYYEDIPMDINIRSFGGELECFCYNFSPDPANRTPAVGTPSRTRLFGNSVEPVDPNLKGQYIDEFLVGAEREVAPSFVVGVRYNYRTLGRVIEDFLVPALGEYRIANPAEGTLGQSLGFFDYTSAPAPAARRVNHAVEVTAQKRFTNNWQFLASYVWQKLEGNYDGTFQNSTGQLDPNINSAFDYGDFLTNANGRLTNDRRHQLKLDGFYTFGNGAASGLTLGLSTRWLSGVPLTAYGYSFAYQNWEYYLTPRGSLGEGPTDYEADVHADYKIKLGSTSASLIADVFNIFNRQAITSFDQRYNLISDGLCAGIPASLCNGDGGLQHKPNSVDPLAQLTSPLTTHTNPDFLKQGNAFTGQRSLRVGVRFTF